jgi:hypothetical protein
VTFASGLSDSARAELARLLARGLLRCAATRSEHTDANVSVSCARNSQNRVDEIAKVEAPCGRAIGGARS